MNAAKPIPEYDAVIRNAVWVGKSSYGKVYGDKKGRFKDGTPITTSTVSHGYNLEIYHTRNSVYKVEWAHRAPLENPSPMRDVHFPAGAIHNGHVFIERIDGNRDNPPEWEELKKCFNYMADYIEPQTNPRELITQLRDALARIKNRAANCADFKPEFRTCLDNFERLHDEANEGYKAANAWLDGSDNPRTARFFTA
jgi:hypothetical protein